MNATLPVITPPTLRCKYFQVAGKHFLCVEGEFYNRADVNWQVLSYSCIILLQCKRTFLSLCIAHDQSTTSQNIFFFSVTTSFVWIPFFQFLLELEMDFFLF